MMSSKTIESNDNIDAILSTRINQYNDFIKAHKNEIFTNSDTDKRLQRIEKTIESTHIVPAIVIQFTYAGETKIAAKTLKSGDTAYFKDCDLPEEGIIGDTIYLLHHEKRTSQKGRDYLICTAWSNKNPLDNILAEKIELLAKKKSNGVNGDLIVKLNEMKSLITSTVIIKKIHEYTGNWKVLFVIVNFPSLSKDLHLKYLSIHLSGEECQYTVVISIDNKKYYKIDIDSSRPNIEYIKASYLLDEISKRPKNAIVSDFEKYWTIKTNPSLIYQQSIDGTIMERSIEGIKEEMSKSKKSSLPKSLHLKTLPKPASKPASKPLPPKPTPKPAVKKPVKFPPRPSRWGYVKDTDKKQWTK
jgi:hypothetical protein